MYSDGLSGYYFYYDRFTRYKTAKQAWTLAEIFVG